MVKIHFRVDGCFGNVNDHRHVIDTGKFSLIRLELEVHFSEENA